MIEFKPYKAEDAMEILTRLSDDEDSESNRIACEAKLYGLATSVFYHGKPIVCYGIMPMFKGTGEMWALFDRDMVKNISHTALKLSRALIDDMMKSDWHRIQATVLSTDTQAIKYAKFLGMNEEGLLRSLDGNRNDYYMFARVA